MPIVLRSSIKPTPIAPEESVGYCYSPRLFAAMLTRLIMSPRLQTIDSPVWFQRNVFPAHYCKNRPGYWRNANSYTPFNNLFCLHCKTCYSVGTDCLFTAICSACPPTTIANGAAFHQAAHYSEVVRSTTKEIRRLIEQELVHYAKNYL